MDTGIAFYINYLNYSNSNNNLPHELTQAVVDGVEIEGGSSVGG